MITTPVAYIECARKRQRGSVNQLIHMSEAGRKREALLAARQRAPAWHSDYCGATDNHPQPTVPTQPTVDPTRQRRRPLLSSEGLSVLAVDEIRYGCLCTC